MASFGRRRRRGEAWRLRSNLSVCSSLDDDGRLGDRLQKVRRQSGQHLHVSRADGARSREIGRATLAVALFGRRLMFIVHFFAMAA